MPPNLERGRIVYCSLGPRGDYKRRPAVVLGSGKPDEHGMIRVVAASTGGTDGIAKPLPINQLALPHLDYPRKHPYTKLCRETVAVCDWIVRINIADILDFGGVLPAQDYFKLRMKMQELFGTDEPEATETHVAQF